MMKRFWSDGEFTLPSGEGYTGYALVDGKNASTITGTSLTPIANGAASFAVSTFQRDRLLPDIPTLPYNKHQVTFAPNDFLSTATLKAIVKRLHANNMYLYRCAFVHDTTLPGRDESEVASYLPTPNALMPSSMANRNMLGATGEAPELPFPFFSTEAEKAPFDLCDIVAADMKVLRSKGNGKVELLLLLVLKDRVLFAKTILDCSNGEAEEISTEQLHSMETIDPQNGNSLRFINLVDAKISGNSLYILDSGLNLLVKYDISSLTDRDGSANSSKVFLVDTLQGKGRKTDNLYFDTPTALDVSGDYLYIADNGNRCIKKYTATLDYIKTFRNGHYVANDIRSLAYNPYPNKLEDGTEIPAGSLWVLSESANHLYISILAADKHISSFIVERINLAGEEDEEAEEHGKTIRFSPTDSNTFYIATTKRIFKLHCSRPSMPFASISFTETQEQIANNIWRKVETPWEKFKTTWEKQIEESRYGNG